jgi:hypothetical protein
MSVWSLSSDVYLNRLSGFRRSDFSSAAIFAEYLHIALQHSRPPEGIMCRQEIRTGTGFPAMKVSHELHAGQLFHSGGNAFHKLAYYNEC